MEQEQIIRDFIELCQVEVHSRDERRIADVMKEKLEALGVTVTEDTAGKTLGGNTGNLYGRLPGDPALPAILFSAHLDRVGNNGHIHPIWDKEKNIIHTDKTTILAADDVAGLAAMLHVLRTVKEDEIPHGDIELAISVCEEVGVLGSALFDFSRFHAKIGFVLDIGGPAGKIVTSAPGKGRVTITIHGRSAHAGNAPEKGLNALKVAGALLTRIPDGRLSPTGTANFSIISAGTATNVVCDHVELIGEQRSTDSAEYKDISRRIREAAEAVAEEYGTTIDVAIEDQYAAYHLAEDAPCCRLAAAAARAVGVEPHFVRGGGGTDGNHLNEHGIATAALGVGYSKNHTPEEEIDVAEYLKACRQAVEIVRLSGSGAF